MRRVRRRLKTTANPARSVFLLTSMDSVRVELAAAFMPRSSSAPTLPWLFFGSLGRLLGRFTLGSFSRGSRSFRSSGNLLDGDTWRLDADDDLVFRRYQRDLAWHLKGAGVARRV